MCRKNVLTIVAVAIVPLAIGQVQAVTVPVPIDNPGFEDSVLPDGEYDYSLDNQGWGYFANGGEQGSWNPGLPGTSEPGYGGNAPEGQNVGWVNPGGVGVPGGLAQVLTDADATLQADTTYTLTVEVGNTPGYPWNGYKVQLLAGGTPHTPGTGAYTGPVTGGILLAEDNNSLTIAVDTFETSTVTYTYDPELHSGLLGEPLQIRLLSLGNVVADDYTEADFDNVTLSYDAGAEPGVTIPVGWWQFEGNASDSSGNGYDGILSADPDPVPVWTTDPERGNVLEFVPGLDYVDCGPGVSAGQDLTVALWIKPADVELMRPISCFDGEDYSENPGWFLMLRHDDWYDEDLDFTNVPPNLWFRMTGTEGEWNSGDLWINECWAPGEWVHMAFTFDEATDTLSGYINGQLAGVTVVPEGRSVASDTNPLIMGHGGGAEQYEGLMDDVYIYDVVLTDSEIWNLVYPITITVPNGDFEEIYKPGSDTIIADLGGGWTQGVGPNTPMDDGIATYSDGTTGDGVDIPGWIGADTQGWVDAGGTYDRDTDFPNRQGSIARQSSTPDGLYYYLSNGGGWGNPAGGLVVSDAPLATIESGLTYTLSMLANGGATPVVLELLADGVALTPSSSVDPVLSDEWQEFSRTYDAASLDVHLGESLTIRLGVGRGASGDQSHFDAVSLSYVPEPAELVSLIEDFDSLAIGSNMHDVDGWEGWFGDAQWAAQVTDVVAYSGTNSLEIVGNRDDLVPNWPQQTTGKWMLSVMQYCPSDKQTTGLVYFGPLTEYDGATETVGWIGEFMANFETGKAYCNADQAIQVDLVYDDWAELRLEVDLDAQEADFYYNDVFLSTQPAPSIAGVDIWPDENIVGVYFDDFRFESAE